MDYRKWIEMLGRTSEDAAVKDELKKGGVTKKLVMPRDELDLLVSVPGMTLRFQDADSLDDIQPVGTGNCVLTAVTIHLDEYTGPLPLNIKANTTRDQLFSQLGSPLEQEEAAYGHIWRIADRLNLEAYFSSDGKSLESLVLELPEP